MASAVRKHSSYGNVAFDTSVGVRNEAAPQRKRNDQPQLEALPLVKPRERHREQAQTRTRVALRPLEEYSFLPAVGFLAVAFMAVMIIVSYCQLNTIYAETVQTRSELRTLQTEEITLKAQYEEIFDQAALQAAVAGAGSNLSEARNGQKIYVDLSEPDNAVVYSESRENALLQSMTELWSALTE